MIINDTLHILFRRVQPEMVIKHWLGTQGGKAYTPISLFALKENKAFEKELINLLQNEFDHYTVDEALYALRYIKEYELSGFGKNSDFGIFGMVAKSVEDMLTTDSNNECLCKSKELLAFRNLTHTIDPTIFISAFLAKYDTEHSFNRNVFSWNPVVRSDDPDLQFILNKGMAENHFHIGGSSNAFLFSWICLANHFTPERKKEFYSSIDAESLDTVYTSAITSHESNYLLTFKAVCIRYFLFMRLHNQWPLSGNPADNLREKNENWLKKILSLSEDDCSLYMHSINKELYALRTFCSPADGSGFIPDYALAYEPLHQRYDSHLPLNSRCAVRDYERRLFRPFAGEQRLQYDLFKAVFQKDERIMPYLDLIYAYFLIYCKVRGELMQVNTRIGFGNFLKYQNRKNVFTKKYCRYQNMRTGIAERVVLENPQIKSFEGRFTPGDTPEKIIATTKWLIDIGTQSIPGVSDFYDDNPDNRYHLKEKELREKIHFVIHFAKSAQSIRENEKIELIKPHDNIVREKSMIQANAFLEARKLRPDIMNTVKGVDACSNEIDCRPEVFACAIRKVCFPYQNTHDFSLNKISNMHITYHAGEDFLDPLDGLRAIDEAVYFCNMKSGDRIGHALALGIDCEKWYSQKDFTVLMHSQELLDNIVWLYGAMRRYKIDNVAAENEIRQQFTRLFSSIYLSTSYLLHTTDLEQYYLSMQLRGNDPELYFFNPETENNKFRQAFSDTKPWQIINKNTNGFNILPDLLYHCYHYDYSVKRTSEKTELYYVPKAIAEVVSEVQKKMQYDIAEKNIFIECNPSSNFLIGTFKDYLQHPIFKFNNKNLFDSETAKNYGKNPHINASVNTDDLGIFDTSLENEYAILLSAFEKYNEFSPDEQKIQKDNILDWLDNIRENGIKQVFGE